MASKNKEYSEKDWIKDYGSAYGIDSDSSYQTPPKRKKSVDDLSDKEKEFRKNNPGYFGGKKRRKKSRKRRKSRKRSKSRKRRRRRRGGSQGEPLVPRHEYQLQKHPIIPSMEFGCGRFDSACRSARKASREAGNNDAYCQYVTPKLAAYVKKKPCPATYRNLMDYKTASTEWSRAANAKCISDEAVCPTYYPATSRKQAHYKEPKGVNATTLEEMQQQMDSGHIIVPSVVKDFGGNKEKAFAWLKDKLQKEKDAYDSVNSKLHLAPGELIRPRLKRRGTMGGRRKSRRRKSRRRKKRSRRRRK